MSTVDQATTQRPNRTSFIVLAALAATVVAMLALALGGIPGTDASDRAASHPRRHACRAVARDLQRTQETLARLVADGTLDQTQADAVAAGLVADAPDSYRACTARIVQRLQIVQDIGTLLNLTPEEIRDRLVDGESLAEIAAAQGVDRADLVSTLREAATERLDQAVANGTIDEERRAALEERAVAAIDRLVDHHRDARPFPFPDADELLPDADSIFPGGDDATPTASSPANVDA